MNASSLTETDHGKFCAQHAAVKAVFEVEVSPGIKKLLCLPCYEELLAPLPWTPEQLESGIDVKDAVRKAFAEAEANTGNWREFVSVATSVSPVAPFPRDLMTVFAGWLLAKSRERMRSAR